VTIFKEDSTCRLILGRLRVCFFVLVEFRFIFFLSAFFPTKPVVVNGVIASITTAIAAITSFTRAGSAGQSCRWRSNGVPLCLCRHCACFGANQPSCIGLHT